MALEELSFHLMADKNGYMLSVHENGVANPNESYSAKFLYKDRYRKIEFEMPTGGSDYINLWLPIGSPAEWLELLSNIVENNGTLSVDLYAVHYDEVVTSSTIKIVAGDATLAEVSA